MRSFDLTRHRQPSGAPEKKRTSTLQGSPEMALALLLVASALAPRSKLSPSAVATAAGMG